MKKGKNKRQTFSLSNLHKWYFPFWKYHFPDSWGKGVKLRTGRLKLMNNHETNTRWPPPPPLSLFTTPICPFSSQMAIMTTVATSSVHSVGTKGHLNNTSGASWASSPLAAESISWFGETYGVKWVGKGKRKQTLAFVWPWKYVVCALTWSCWFGDFKQDCARFHVPDFEPGEVYLVNIFLWSAQIICRGREIQMKVAHNYQGISRYSLKVTAISESSPKASPPLLFVMQKWCLWRQSQVWMLTLPCLDRTGRSSPFPNPVPASSASISPQGTENS